MKIFQAALFMVLAMLFSCEEQPTNDFRLPEVSGEGVTVDELDEDHEIDITLSLNKPLSQEIIVNYSTANGTAIAGRDYISRLNQKLVYEPGDLSKTVTITIIGDQYEEEQKYFLLEITSAVNASVATSEITITIRDSDTLPRTSDLELPERGYSTPLSYEGYDLVWQDEFNDGELSSDWTYEIGTGSNGWGNNELQYYTDENVSFEEGNLVITAREESRNGRNYTSSRIITEGEQSFQYGRIDIRAVLPRGQGLWPALWMLGSNFRQVGWPYCGEIDIMELTGGPDGDNRVYGTIHWQGPDGYASFGGSTTIDQGTFGDQYHVFTILWDETKIEWLLDDVKYHEVDITPDHLSELRAPQFFIFNVAVGGNFPGNPDETTVFPQRMAVDYVRVFQKN